LSANIIPRIAAHCFGYTREYLRLTIRGYGKFFK
jgi:hypothetical protein